MEAIGHLHAPIILSLKKNLYTNTVRGFVVTGLDMKAIRKITAPYRESNPTHPANRRSLYRLSYASLLEEYGSFIKKTKIFLV
jgi:hypothetical protein